MCLSVDDMARGRVVSDEVENIEKDSDLLPDGNIPCNPSVLSFTRSGIMVSNTRFVDSPEGVTDIVPTSDLLLLSQGGRFIGIMQHPPFDLVAQ